MRICFFTKHEITWGSSRERIGAYLERIKERGHTYEIIHCIPNRLTQLWISGGARGSLFNRAYSLWNSRIFKHLKFIWIIVRARKFDVVVIQKVNLPYSLVWILKLRNGNIIFDFDDLCFWGLESTQKKIGFVRRLSLWRRGLQHPRVLKLCRRIIAGNGYLAGIAAAMKGGEGVTTIPTSINCELYKPRNRARPNSPIVIGWAGAGENHLRHLELLVNPLKILERNNTFIFKLVGAMRSKRIKALFDFLGVRFQCIDWVEAHRFPEVIRSFDIGVMPLRDDEEARAKCGFKVLAYMASGVSAVASPVGVNKEIIKDGTNGFLARDTSEWVKKISALIENEGLRDDFARRGRRDVEESYSLNKASDAFLDVIERI